MEINIYYICVRVLVMAQCRMKIKSVEIASETLFSRKKIFEKQYSTRGDKCIRVHDESRFMVQIVPGRFYGSI